MNTYKTLSGRTIVYDAPDLDVAVYLDRVKLAAVDPAVTYPQILALVHHADNPVLDKKYLPGRGSITTAVLANPVYQVMADLIGVAISRGDHRAVRGVRL